MSGLTSTRSRFHDQPLSVVFGLGGCGRLDEGSSLEVEVSEGEANSKRLEIKVINSALRHSYTKDSLSDSLKPHKHPCQLGTMRSLFSLGYSGKLKSP